MKATGAEIKDFYENGWPEGYVIDDYVVDPDDELEPTTKYDLDDFGFLYLEENPVPGQELSFEDAFKRWKKARDTATVVVTVPKDKLDELKAAVKALGGKLTT